MRMMGGFLVFVKRFARLPQTAIHAILDHRRILELVQLILVSCGREKAEFCSII
jgi:hypothetical protein